MRQRLGQVAQERAVARVDLLREQADVIGQREELLQRRRRLVDAAAAGERVGEPERTREEGALFVLHAAVAIEQRAAGAELVADRVDRAREALGLVAQIRAAAREQDGGV